MLFNSVQFALFFLIVFFVYWSLQKRLKAQNIFLVLASWFFYGYWDWRFLFLIIFTSATSYLSGILIENSKTKTSAKAWMWSNVAVNLIILGFFKYFNFFTDNLIAIANAVGWHLDEFTLNIILPIGISFYTFQAISYSIDVYKQRIPATRNIWAFFGFVAFFPQLIAGPIERAGDLLPQIENKRTFDYDNAVVGLRQILWGLFKKVVVADTCAHYADLITMNPEYYAGSSLIVGVILILIQYYGDYSGYSDIAVGLGRLLGINLTANFRFPMFSRSFNEFWQRWNVTLMRWFRDYIYIPLGGSHCSKPRQLFNILMVFVVSGLWHGADWAFVLWGIVNALLVFPAVIFGIKPKKTVPVLKEIPSMIFVILVMSFVSIVMKLQSFDLVVNYFSLMSFDPGQWFIATGKTPFMFIIPMLIIEWYGRRNDFALEKLPFKTPVRYAIYWVLIIAIIYGCEYDTQPYLYFQF